jgi:antitoxin component YwqK of YwqJK toxin-antitoxin module
MIFFTKQVNSCIIYDLWYFYCNETDAYLSKDYYSFGKLTGKYESTDLHGEKIIRYISNGHLNSEDDKPAFISYYANGNKRNETWRLNGQLHREDDRPAYIHYYPNGNKQLETWYVNDHRHREGDKPAKIHYHGNGNKQYEELWVNDKLH